jgi:hypothetical protein
MSYEAVLAILLDAIPPQEFAARRRLAMERARESLADMGRRRPQAAAEEGRRLEEARIARLKPAQRMEEAYRLFALSRGSA